MSHKKKILYSVLGIAAAGGIFAIIYETMFPNKPNTAGANAGAAAGSTNNSTSGSGTAAGAGSTTTPGSGSTAGSNNASSQAASTNPTYTLVSWNDVKVGDKLASNDNTTSLWRTGLSDYFGERVYYVPKGTYYGQVQTKYQTGGTVANWNVPTVTWLGTQGIDSDHIFYMDPAKTYRKLLS